MNLKTKIADLPGPILIIGASGFIGANLLKALLAERDDVAGTIFSGKSWRLSEIPARNLKFLNLSEPSNVRSVLRAVAPRTIFDCSSFGAYSFEQDYDRIHTTNYFNFIRILEEAAAYELAAYIHAGSSSEYGLNALAPQEDDLLLPNSHYAVSKAAASHAISYFGKVRGLPVINLRLYSVYGPYEDSSRLIPVLCKSSLEGKLPVFARAEVSRDFIHIDDVVEAFVDATLAMDTALAGDSYNIGTGVKTSLASLAHLTQSLFGIDEAPQYSSSAGRAWDTDDWLANPNKAFEQLHWRPTIDLESGLIQTREWWREAIRERDFSRMTKKEAAHKEKTSISAVVACYQDGLAIPQMHKRLTDVFNRLDIDYEILFINDASPDNSAEVIRQLSALDCNVIGVTHSRNFGSQAAFRSGMELASKEACVLLDGDLQDPPELIAEFVEQWRAGAEVVYGRRVKRDMPRWLETCYRGFYQIFSALSEVPVPKNAGDFSLMDRSVVHWILECRERDVFLRGLRAYVGFNQVGVDYIRPERAFGKSTNNWIKNIGWAKKAIFSFSRMPLHMLTAFGGIAFAGTVVLAIISILIRLLAPESVPRGITFVSLIIMFFGSFTILAIGLLGEYIGKIFEESKARPAFIRRSIIVRGEIKSADPLNNR